MAKEKPKPAPPKPATPSKPTPYPRTWGSMDKVARQEWMKTHRPDRPQAVAVAPVKAPAPAPAPIPAPIPTSTGDEQPSAKNLVQINVVRYSVVVGTLEPVECAPEELLYTVDAQLDTWEEQCQGEGEGEEEGEDDDS